MLDLAPWLETIYPLWLPLSVIFLYLGTIIIIAESLTRIITDNGEVTRKVVHIGTGNVILLAWWFNIPTWVGITASIIAATIALISYFLPILPSINSVGRQSWGTFFYAISIGVLVAWFWPLNLPQYAAIGILIMTWGDGLAAIIGQNYGKHPYQVFGITKSWEGSLTMTVVSFLIISLILGWEMWIIAATVAIIATILEAFSKLGIDNLTVPIAGGAISFFLTQFL